MPARHTCRTTSWIVVFALLLSMLTPMVVWAAAPTSGLVGFWTFDESSGTALADSSGRGNNGTVYGASWTSGKMGGALSFDGANDYVQVPNSSSLGLNTYGTLSVWVLMPDADLEGGCAILAKQSGWHQPGFVFNTYPYANDFWLYSGGGSGKAFDANLKNGCWHHLAAVMNGSTAALYVDGVNKTTSSAYGPLTASSVALRIGGHTYSGSDEYFKGKIDHVRIYNRALSSAEIAELVAEAPRDPVIVTITDPFSTATLPQDNVSMAATASSTVGGVTITKVEFFNGATLLGTDTSAPYQHTWAGVAPGPYTLKAKATASNGATGEDTVKITVTARQLVSQWKFDDGSGTTALDASGNGHHGTLLGGAGWGTGQFGGALSLDGANDYMTRASGSPLPTTSPLTVTAWVRTTAAKEQAFFGQGAPTNYWIGAYFMELTTAGKVHFYGMAAPEDRTLNLTSSASVNNGAWRHVVCQRNSSGRARIYIDGQLDAEKYVDPVWFFDGPVHVGSAAWQPQVMAKFFQGRIDDVRLYNWELSASEIQTVMAGGDVNTDPVPPDAPSVLVAIPLSTNEIQLTWTDNSDNEAGFKIDRRVSGGSTWDRIAEPGADATVYADTGLPADTTYYYMVKAWNAAGNSAYSDVAAATTLDAPTTVVLVTTNAAWRYFEGTQEASDPRSAWREADFDASAWPSGAAPIGYPADWVATCLDGMKNTYGSFFMRKTFTAGTTDADTRLRVTVQYDDGFILWVNGERVAAENEPDGAPTYDSLASGYVDAPTNEVFDLGRADDLLEPGSDANVVAVQVFNSGLGSGDCGIGLELSTYKRVADTTFSSDRGFYAAPFDLTISTATPGAVIRYTTDGGAPTATTGTAGGTNTIVTIGATTCIRAAAFKGGYDPTDVDTHTYIFVAAVLRQSDQPAGYPSIWPHMNDWGNGGEGEDKPADYGMDANIVNDSRYAPTIANDLKALPSLCLVSEIGELFGEGGVYSEHGSDDILHPVSAELIYPDGYPLEHEGGFQIDCAIEAQSWTMAKRSLRLSFRSAYGPSKLRYPVFENAPLDADTATDTFNRLILRSGSNDRFLAGDQGGGLADEWARRSQEAISGVSSHGTFVHLYLNGMYWGIYNMVERPDASFTSAYYGGEKDDWFATNHGHKTAGDGISGDPTRWWYCVDTLMTRDMSVAANYREAAVYIDLAQYVDYIVLWWYCGGGDWPVNNWYAGNRNLPVPGPARYFVWDIESSWYNNPDSPNRSDDGAWIHPNFLTAAEGSPNPYNATTHKQVARPFRSLWKNADFRALFADRFYKHCYNNGPLTDPNAKARYNALAAFIANAVVPESARWGDNDLHTYIEPPLHRDVHWSNQVEAVRGHMTGNVDRFLGVLRNQTMISWKMYPALDPPAFHQHGGVVSAGFKLTMSNPNGSGMVVYMTDGNDPRAAGGGRASGAADYAGPLTLSRTTHVKARVRASGGTWSAVHAATFNYTAHYSRIRITELMYNPLGGRDYEFIEIRNTGASTRGLSEMTLKGVRYTFAPGAELEAGATALLVRNEAAFTNRYPSAKAAAALFGVYAGTLDNGGERIALLDCEGRTVTSVRYNDKAPWPAAADGDGFSLVPVDENADPDDPGNWRASNLIGGSPGRTDGPACHVVVSEALSHTDPPAKDAIELHNTGVAPADIGGWYLSDSTDNYRKYAIPAGTTIAAGGYVVFDEADFNTDTNNPACFALSSHGDEALLTHWDEAGNMLYLAEARFGGAANGVAFARHMRTDGEADFVAQSTATTLGAANAYPRVGPVVITEIMYHPAPGGDEFIELRNISGGAVKLYDPERPANGWELDGAVGYMFPADAELEADGYALVVPTNAAAFRAKYAIPAEVPIFGPYSGALNNGGESVKLWRPDTPDEEGVPRILVDRVQYRDAAPWPTCADGAGPSLERIAPTLYGNDPANWAAGAAAGGTPGAPNSGVFVARTAGWRYHDAGYDLGTAWRAAGYDDAAWLDGNAPLGYSYPVEDPEIDTKTDWGDDPNAKRPTTYFRTAFTLDEPPASVSSLILRIRYDDGYVAYLNGQPVAWAGLDPATVGFNTYASTSGSGTDYDLKDITTAKTHLVAGPGQINVLAIEVHQSSGSSSDIFLDAELMGTVNQAPRVAAPSFDPPAGSFTHSLAVTVSTTTAGATVFYTIDGTTPSDSAFDGWGLGRARVLLTDSATVKAVGYHSAAGLQPSLVAAASYTKQPEAPTQLWTAYNDLAWASGQLAVNISTVTRNQNGPLVDHETGANLPVTLSINGGGWGPVSDQGGAPAAGTDGYAVFAEKVSLEGLISYDQTAGDLTLTLGGLIRTYRYEIVLFGNRAGASYTARTTTVTLSGAEPGFLNASTAGAIKSTSVTSDDTTTIANGYNTVNGYVARYTEVDPGTDGAVVLTVPAYGGTGEAGKCYLNALMVRAVGEDSGGDVVAMEKGGSWRYRKGTAEAAKPAEQWRARDYGDSGWSSGSAPFGYGPLSYGTVLNDMQNSYTCVFLRRAFTLAAPAEVLEITLDVDYDDGFVAWLNGQEVARVNVQGEPATFVAHNSTCSGYVSAAAVSWRSTLDGGDIPPLYVTNVFAVQLFNNSLGSSDANFDAQLAVRQAHLAGAQDANENRLPDDWEADQGTTGGAGADDDSDGCSNYEEWVAGSGATDATDYLAVDAGSTAGGLMIVSFAVKTADGPGYAGLTRHYQLQSCAGLAAATDWLPVAGYEDIVALADGLVSYTNAPGDEATRYYRTRVWLQD
ncbi:MAG: lamin tail domain-containing protein [Kiritimatiellae bacterium]|nr:lamin tail domain-containing protein [Kiritimatiellia bacterium]